MIYTEYINKTVKIISQLKHWKILQLYRKTDTNAKITISCVFFEITNQILQFTEFVAQISVKHVRNNQLYTSCHVM